MITGSNTNIRYRGKLFHIQTEDSGRRNPHVISHLYYGGTILASQKTRYAELLDLESETIDKDVKLLMDEQHALMLERLKGGVYDDVISERLGGDTGGSGTEPVAPPLAAAPDAPAEARPAAQAKPPAKQRTFGEGIGSQKPLDELILEYLVEKAHERTPERAAPGAKRSSEKG